MRIKNVSSTLIPLPEFNLQLSPGDIGDLSSFDPKAIHSHKLLAAYLENGLLVNLGTLVPAGSMAALKSARNRIEKLGFNDYVAKKATPSSSNRAKIDQLLKRPKYREPSEGKFNQQNERYSEEYYYNKLENVPETPTPKPRPKIDNNFKSMQIDPLGTVVEFGAYGRIDTEALVGKTALIVPPVQEKDTRIVIKDTAGNEFKVSLDNIKERLQRKCIGANASGKQCKKWAVSNFHSCLTHMSRTEKEEYEKLRKSQ